MDLGPNYSISTACALVTMPHVLQHQHPSYANNCQLKFFWVLCCRGSALVAMDVGFMGPNYSISTACATANYCFVAAANHIRKGDADIIIAGGSEAPIIPVGLGGFVACRSAGFALHPVFTRPVTWLAATLMLICQVVAAPEVAAC